MLELLEYLMDLTRQRSVLVTCQHYLQQVYQKFRVSHRLETFETSLDCSLAHLEGRVIKDGAGTS